MNDSDQTNPSNESLLAYRPLGDFLEQDGWHPQEIEGRLAYYMGYSGKNGFIHTYARIPQDSAQLICYATVADRVPPALLSEAAEFITRANHGLHIGNFEMDYQDGEVRFKSSLDFTGVELTPALIRNTLYPAVQILDTYLPGLMNVISGGKSALEAIHEVEGH